MTQLFNRKWCGCRRKAFGLCGCFVWVESAKTSWPCGTPPAFYPTLFYWKVFTCKKNYSENEFCRWPSLQETTHFCSQYFAWFWLLFRIFAVSKHAIGLCCFLTILLFLLWWPIYQNDTFHCSSNLCQLFYSLSWPTSDQLMAQSHYPNGTPVHRNIWY